MTDVIKRLKRIGGIGPMEDRAWHGNKAPLLVTARQARSLFKADVLGKVLIHNDDGMYGVKIIANDAEYQIGDRDFTKARRWVTRDKAISYICTQLALPDNLNIEFVFKRQQIKEDTQR